MYIDDENIDGAAAARRNGGEEHGHCVGGGDLTLDLDAFHCASRIVADARR